MAPQQFEDSNRHFHSKYFAVLSSQCLVHQNSLVLMNYCHLRRADIQKGPYYAFWGFPFSCSVLLRFYWIHKHTYNRGVKSYNLMLFFLVSFFKKVLGFWRQCFKLLNMVKSTHLKKAVRNIMLVVSSTIIILQWDEIISIPYCINMLQFTTVVSCWETLRILLGMLKKCFKWKSC